MSSLPFDPIYVQLINFHKMELYLRVFFFSFYTCSIFLHTFLCFWYFWNVEHHIQVGRFDRNAFERAQVKKIMVDWCRIDSLGSVVKGIDNAPQSLRFSITHSHQHMPSTLLLIRFPLSNKRATRFYSWSMSSVITFF